LTAERTKEIDRKLEEHRRRLLAPTKFAGAKVMSRQEMDLEQAITRNRENSKHLACLVTDGSRIGAIDPDHPINHLEEILEKVSTRITNKAKRRCKLDNGGRNGARGEELKGHRMRGSGAKGSGHKSEEEEEDSDGSIIQGDFNVPNRPEGWDEVSEGDRRVSEGDHRVSEGDGVVLLLPDGTKAIQGNIESIPEDIILRYKLTPEQIRALPRFKDYVPGKPNQVRFCRRDFIGVT